MKNHSSNLLQDVIHNKSLNNLKAKSAVWGSVNLVVMIAVLIELSFKQLICIHPVMWWASVFFCSVCGLNVLFYLKTYIELHLNQNVVLVTDKQKSLYSICNADAGFKVKSADNVASQSPNVSVTKFSELLESTMLKSMHSSFTSCGNSPTNQYLMTSRDETGAINSSWYGHPTSPVSPINNQVNRSFPSDYRLQSPNWTCSPHSPQQNYSNNSFQNLFEEKEASYHLASSEDPNNFSGSFWSYSSQGVAHLDQLAALKKNLYQPASKDSDVNTSASANTKTDSNSASTSTSLQVWQKRNVTPQQLFKYEENMRIWISMNILQPLVKLIDECNKSLASVAPEIQIGCVGIEKLKKVVQNISGVKQLNNILPFLDITVHQDYLVQRLEELAKGGAISNFKWNSGGKFNGKEWRDEFPTDSYILIHLFALYMDNHLPPDPTQPDGRLFSNLHLIKTPEKPAKPPTNPALYMAHINPPDLKVIIPSEGEVDVGSGHKNCLHALILFCHHIVHQEHSHIAGINLQLSGINLAWVVS